MFNMIPLPYKILAATALIISVFFFGYMKGTSNGKAELQKFAAIKQAQITELEKKNNEISSSVQVEYVDKVRTIKEKEYVYRDIAQNTVPSQHVMSNGWVYTHDISATTGDAEPTRASDAAASGVKDTEALLGIIRNYSICQANSVQLTELQRWIRENKAAVDELNTKEKKRR